MTWIIYTIIFVVFIHVSTVFFCFLQMDVTRKILIETTLQAFYKAFVCYAKLTNKHNCLAAENLYPVDINMFKL